MTTVGVFLTGDPTNVGAGANINLLSDAGGAPGSVLLYLTSISDPSYVSCIPVCDVTAVVSYALDPNTRYWIQVVDNSLSGYSTSAMWAYSNDTSGTGVGGEFHANQNGVFPNDSAYQIQVSATPATPEPGSLLLLGSGLVGVVGAVKRKLC